MYTVCRERERERERESKNESIFIAMCSKKRSAISYKIYLNSILKNLNTLFHPIKSFFFIHIKVRKGESGHLNMNA